MIKISFNKSKIYLLACSYGPDSMALFDILCKNRVNFVVCHVNYHKRGEVSNYEEKALREYCLNRKINFECLDTSLLTKPIKKVNFQAYAREIRYLFFKEMYEKYNADGLFVAHQLDDLLETYLIQKERKAFVSYYGLAEESYRYGMRTLRPLLKYSKADLEKYDKENGIPFSIDSSNLTDVYKRNKIRHSIIDKFSKSEKIELLKVIKNENSRLKKLDKTASKFVNNKTSLSVKSLAKLDDEQFCLVLFKLLNHYNVYSISKETIISLKKILFSHKPNIKVKLEDNIYYCQEYGEVLIYEIKPNYSYKIEKPGVYVFDEFELDFTDAIDRNIHISDYPLTIRNANKNDIYIIKDYVKKVNRLFLDWKMPWHLREEWPVVVNKKGEIIYIPRYRKKFIDNHSSKFKILIK